MNRQSHTRFNDSTLIGKRADLLCIFYKATDCVPKLSLKLLAGEALLIQLVPSDHVEERRWSLLVSWTRPLLALVLQVILAQLLSRASSALGSVCTDGKILSLGCENTVRLKHFIFSVMIVDILGELHSLIFLVTMLQTIPNWVAWLQKWSHSSGSWRSEIQVSAGLVPSGACEEYRAWPLS